MTLRSDLHGGGFLYIRAYYKVPAQRGGRVRYRGKPGRILSTTGHYLWLMLDGETRRTGPCHPTWEMEYLPAPPVSQETKEAQDQ
jgi:hypothetical protein